MNVMNTATKVLVPLAAVLLLVAIPWIGTGLVPGQYVFGVIVPYLALVAFVAAQPD